MYKESPKELRTILKRQEIDFIKFYNKELRMVLNSFYMAMYKHPEKMIPLLQSFDGIFKIPPNRNNYTIL